MKKLIAIPAIFIVTLGLLVAGTNAQGPQGQPFQALLAMIDDLQDQIDAIVAAQPPTVIASDDHGDASQSYADAEVVDYLNLTEGDWKITATGAVTLTGEAVALNCGLRVEDADSATGYKMLAKQNPAVGGETGRVGFSVVGAVEGPENVELVCYGGGNLPFEHNMVAIGGN